jgi:phosphoribosyl-ATP pyrophosphohydrolase/phosphoribosyl-AMP cyclohydrolase
MLAIDVSSVDFAKYDNGLVPVIVQHHRTGRILMLGFASRQALEQTQHTGEAHFYSRSRKALWKKGETSGNVLKVFAIKLDCDSDTLIYVVLPHGPTCHTGEQTCFFQGDTATHTDAEFIDDLENLIDHRQKSLPKDSYLTSLFTDGLDRIAQKVGEEAVETVIAAKNDDDEDLKNEAADLLFHYLVLLHAKGCNLHDVVDVLRERHKTD